MMSTEISKNFDLLKTTLKNLFVKELGELEKSLLTEFKGADSDLRQELKTQFKQLDARISTVEEETFKRDKVLITQLAEEKGKVKFLEMQNRDLESELESLKQREEKRSKHLENSSQMEAPKATPETTTQAQSEDEMEFYEFV